VRPAPSLYGAGEEPRRSPQETSKRQGTGLPSRRRSEMEGKLHLTPRRPASTPLEDA